MKVIAWVALVLGAASIIFSVLIIGSSSGAMAQLHEGDFPLTGLGESVIAMLLPILLSTIAALGSIVTVRRRLGQVSLGVTLLSWFILWKALGSAGFHHLF
jgi:hypothetical protein